MNANKPVTEIDKVKEKNEEAQKGCRSSNEEQEENSQFEELVQRDQEIRDEDLKPYFSGRDLYQYLDDCQKAVNAYLEPRTDSEDWQTRYNALLTRNKLVALMSKVATVLMQYKFTDKSGGGS